MNLTYEQIQRMKEWVASKNLPTHCPLCNGAELRFDGEPGANPFVHMPGFIWSTCKNCGHVTLFDRKVIGI